MSHTLTLICLFATTLLLGQRAPEVFPNQNDLSAVGATWGESTSSFYALSLPEGLVPPETEEGDLLKAIVARLGSKIGVTSVDQLRLKRKKTDLKGSQYLTYQLLHAGIPILGQEMTLKLQQDRSGGAVIGHYLTSNSFPSYTTNSSLSEPTLRQKARALVAQRHPAISEWEVLSHGTWWTSANPWQNTLNNPLKQTKAYEVAAVDGAEAEMVYLDISTGKLVLSTPLDCQINRNLYQRTITTPSIIWREGDAFPGDLNWEEQEMLLATEEAYSLFYRTFGRQGYDDNNGQMRQVVRANLSNCPNASARRNAIYNCEGVVSDDIIAHEWTHNYLNEMNGLLYLFESGAINEAYADIFGEVVDLINGRGNDEGDQEARIGCFDEGLRWKLGEDATALDTIIRDLWQPECRNDPSFRASEDYACLDESEDFGGVHINSGLVNRTFSLLVDGGAHNGEQVVGIGLTKASHIFYHAADKYITPVTDFNALGIMLKQSLHDLRGTDLPALTVLNLPVAASGDTLNAFDSLQLEATIRATGLLEPSPCGFTPTLAQNPPENCASASIPSFVPLLTEDWEGGIPATWEVTEHPEHPDTWDAKPWKINTVLPDGRAGKGLLAPNGDFGDCRSDLDNGFVALTSPPIVFPAGEADFQLSFEHYYAIEEAYDGGVLFFALNGAAFTPIPETAFLFNGYDAPLEPISVNDNPMAGLPAFQGGDQNSTTGSWGTSLVDLSALGIEAGDELQLRWVFSQDGCGGWLGWYLDDVSVGFCGTSILPVTYSFFTANGLQDHVLLEWETEIEDANAGFAIERAEIGSNNFVRLGFVDAVSTAVQYTFKDYTPTPGTSYVYRLRQIDIDGTFAFSPLVTASLPNFIDQLRAYPNPTQDQLTVVTDNSGEVLNLTDLTGRLVLQQALSPDGSTTLTTSSLSPGIYFLRVGDLVKRIIVR